jgi:hypothetical protein
VEDLVHAVGAVSGGRLQGARAVSLQSE